MPQGKRIDRSGWPSAGPHRNLLVHLDRVHEANGTKSLATIAKLMRLSSRTRVSNLLRGLNGALPSDETQLRLLVTALGGGEEDVARGLRLYQKARSSAQDEEPLPAIPRFRLPGAKPPSPIVLYPDILDATVERLKSYELVALVGPAGYGKTALAQQVIRDHRLASVFGEHVYWLSIGRDLDPPDLAQRLNEVTFLASGVRPEVTDPALAAQFLAGRLGEQNCLVFDDIWQQEWPEILRFVAAAAPVLITTRDGTLLGSEVRQHVLTGPSAELGARMLKASVPDLDELDCVRVSRLARARPFLLELVGGQIRQEVGAGRPPRDAVDDLLRRVTATADINGLVESVVGSTGGPNARSLLDWSIERLPAHHASRLRHLALFRSDQEVPLRVLAHVWDVPQHEAFTMADQFRARSLISSLRFEGDDYLVSVHDILLDHLRGDLAPAEHAAMHREFITSFVGMALDGGDFDQVALADAVETHGYLRDNLVWHLRAFISPARLADIITDPDYLGAKVVSAGVGAVLADLASIDDVGDPRTARVIRLAASLRHLRDRASATASIRSFRGEAPTADMPHYRQVLAVLPREVGDAAGGWFACECGVAAVVIVNVEPFG